jgi:hypothetical protein
MLMSIYWILVDIWACSLLMRYQNKVCSWTRSFMYQNRVCTWAASYIYQNGQYLHKNAHDYVTGFCYIYDRVHHEIPIVKTNFPDTSGSLILIVSLKFEKGDLQPIQLSVLKDVQAFCHACFFNLCLLHLLLANSYIFEISDLTTHA